MAELIRVEGRYYILASSSLADERTRVLKHGHTFSVFDRYGDAHPVGLGEQGVYHLGSRFLVRNALLLSGQRPLLIGSTVTVDNTLLAVDLTNPDIPDADGRTIPHGTLHLLRRKFLDEGACYERIDVINHGRESYVIDVTIEVDADFVDIFEVRGLSRPKRGEVREPVVDGDTLEMSYLGLDGVERRTCVTCPEAEAEPGALRARTMIAPKQTVTLNPTYHFHLSGEQRQAPPTYDQAWRVRTQGARQTGEACQVRTSSDEFNQWLDRSVADLEMMTTDTPNGPYPYAGVPWFSAPFGRDGILTAYEMLWADPSMARGVLRYLAASQATTLDESRDEEPGKIVHERRRGEMAALGEVPFGRYYGSADATPLFVSLAGSYLQTTGDVDLVASIWPNICSALDWMDQYGDIDGDGFVEYATRTPTGLVHQGWKDSHDAVSHSDGTLAEGPIALCEVQAYVFGARQAAAMIAEELGHFGQASELRKRAAELRAAFEESFWCERLGTYALALDGQKRPCEVRSSNAGHCLLPGIMDTTRAARVVAGLMSDEMFSGWGVRTLAASEVRYNPMGYHNGTIWPHDNALIAQGLARYGYKREVLRIMGALFDASRSAELHRLPELYCGFSRRPGQALTTYPLACAPQSWAAASVFLLLRACLGLSVDAPAGQVRFMYPQLPEFLKEVEITGLQVGSGSVDLVMTRFPDDVGFHVLRRSGGAEVLTVK